MFRRAGWFVTTEKQTITDGNVAQDDERHRRLELMGENGEQLGQVGSIE